MTEQRTGKATAEVFEQVILRRLGATDDDVLVGPRHGVDVGVVRVADGVAEYRWPAFAWRLGFDAFVESEHTEVLAEPTFVAGASGG